MFHKTKAKQAGDMILDQHKMKTKSKMYNSWKMPQNGSMSTFQPCVHHKVQ